MDDSPRKAGKRFAFGGFRLDEAERLLSKEGEVVRLPPKAFEVLLALVRREGRLVERGELLQTIWPGVHVTEGSLHQQISLLRRELNDEGEPHRFIETVPRVGYRFIAPVTVEPGPDLVRAAAPARSLGRWGAAVGGLTLLAVVGSLFAFRARAPEPDATTRDPEARRAYLRARFFWNKRSPEDLVKAAESYEEAVRHDPRFAAAWAGLADARVLLGVSAGRAHSVSARTAVAKALEIDDSLGAAHGTLAFEKFFFEWDMAGAEREFARALRLAPADATIHQRHAFYLVALGKADEAIAEIRLARNLDPASLSINGDVGEILFWARRFDDAIGEYLKVSEMDAGTGWHGQLGLAYLYSGRVGEARAEFLSRRLPETSNAVFRVFLSAREGRLEEARRALAEVERDSAFVASHPEALASAYATIGDADRALRYLEKAYDERNFGLVFLRVAPPYDGLKDDPRFRDLLRRIGLA